MSLSNTNRERRLGNIFGATGGNYAGNVYDDNYLAPAINTCGGGYREPIVVQCEEIEDKNDINKSDMLVSLFNKQYYIVASRGRDPDNPSDRSAGNPNLEQRLEINLTGFTNTITSVAKDNWLLEIYD